MKIFLFILILAICLFSCDPCGNLDCATSNYYGRFRIISKIDSTDLVFGSKRIYNFKELKFYSVNSNDTIYFESNPIREYGYKYDSVLYVNFYPETFSNVYLKFNNTDLDTLTMTFKKFDTQCCGRITEIDKYFYNGFTQVFGNEGIQTIKK